MTLKLAFQHQIRSIVSQAPFETFNFELTHDLDHGYFRSDFEKVVYPE